MANMKLDVYSQDGSKVSVLEVSKDIFGIEPNKQVMFDAVLTYKANARQATAKTKKRFEVRGGGRKPYRQKGTGRARAGSTRSPIWVGGGTVFGPTGVQNYKIKQNRKEHNLALKSAYSSKVDGLVVLDKLEINGKTKEIIALLKSFELLNKKVLLVSDDLNVLLASGNVTNVTLRDNKNISVYDILNHDNIILLSNDVKKIEEDLK